jgi:predicted acylesterase/phospholipase RssA
VTLLVDPPATRAALESSKPNRYDGVVFAGGGCRCFWQAGFWSVAASALDLRPRVVGSVSAGSAIACAAAAGILEDVLVEMKRRTARNPRNLYLGNWRRQRPIFPHEEIYRQTILETLADTDLESIHAGPDIRVLVSRPPDGLGAVPSLALACVAYHLDKLAREERVHSVWGRRLGFRGVVVSVRSCRTLAELSELILHSSCTPPLLSQYHRDGRPILDGGLVDGAPVELVAEAESALVLVPRHVPAERLPKVAGRTYVVPSRPVPVEVWDYTRPDLLQETFDLGRRDGEAFAEKHLRDAWRPARAVPRHSSGRAESGRASA